ncbi:MAG: nicotinamide riboside transporter PnuC [Bacteroidales bacterium]|nr:nicotinamide riboside transporter PnuC [Bacteroidales bacterium]
MFSQIIHYLTAHYIEVAGFILGIGYVLLAMKQNVWCWILGIGNVILYIIVFYDSALYGDMMLQIFYLFMSFYGLYSWLTVKKTVSTKSGSAISTTSKKVWAGILIFVIVISISGGYLLSFTDNTIPYWDGITTALGLAATWMTAKKLLENWLVWIFTDLLCTVLYFYKSLYPTSIFYLIMSILAIIGYYRWRKEINNHETHSNNRA